MSVGSFGISYQQSYLRHRGGNVCILAWQCSGALQKSLKRALFWLPAQHLAWEITEFRNSSTESFKNFKGVFIDSKI